MGCRCVFACPRRSAWLWIAAVVRSISGKSRPTDYPHSFSTGNQCCLWISVESSGQDVTGLLLHSRWILPQLMCRPAGAVHNVIHRRAQLAQVLNTLSTGPCWRSAGASRENVRATVSRPSAKAECVRRGVYRYAGEGAPDECYRDTQRGEEFERMPPHDVAAEQCVLGGMLLSKDAISDVIEVIQPPDHYRPAHQLIHEAILDLYARGEPADADHRLQRAHPARRDRPDRRRALPAHADRLGADGGQRRLLRADRPRAGGPAAAGRGGHPDRAVRLRRATPTPTTSSTGPRPRSTRSPTGARRGLPPAVGDHARRPRRDRGDRQPRRRHHRRPDRLRRPRLPHQRPAPGPDDRRRRPPRHGQVDPGAGFRPVRRDQDTA